MRDLRTTYEPHTAPFPHQWDCLQASYNKRAFALLMDPGLGKSKVIIDTTVLLFDSNNITGLFILAPNDVHRQWIEEQIPTHMPPRIKRREVLWMSSAKGRITKELESLNRPLSGHLHILSMNHDALATRRGTEAAKRFLKSHRCLFALDESHEFRSPKAARTKSLESLQRLAPIRRIITGTLTGGSPFHLYTQFDFLDPAILNCRSYFIFTHRYADWEDQAVSTKEIDPRTGRRKMRKYEELLGYKSLDQLHDRMKPFVYSRKKEDCEGLPPKMYETVPTHLSAAQVSIYEAVMEQGLVLLDLAKRGKSVGAVRFEDLEEEDLLQRVLDPKDRMTYRIKLTMWLRLQQCTAGIIKDDAGTISIIDGSWDECPRMQAAIAWVEQALTSGSKVIVWANYTPVLEGLSRTFREHGIDNVMVNGQVKGEARREAITAFKNPKGPRTLVAHPRTLGTGNNFEIASYVLYMTRSFSWFQRKQSEDRAHRLSSKGTVTIGDIVAHNSGTDEKELLRMRENKDIVDLLETFDMRELLKC